MKNAVDCSIKAFTNEITNAIDEAKRTVNASVKNHLKVTEEELLHKKQIKEQALEVDLKVYESNYSKFSNMVKAILETTDDIWSQFCEADKMA